MSRLNLRLKIVAVALLTMVAVGFSWLMADEPNRKLIFDPIGHVDSGSAFSVAVGQSRAAALNTLRRRQGFSPYESRSGDTCLTRSYNQQMQLDIFEDMSWRRGTVCLVSNGGVVLEIVWYYNFLAP
jgi:hypothetical protein